MYSEIKMTQHLYCWDMYIRQKNIAFENVTKKCVAVSIICQPREPRRSLFRDLLSKERLLWTSSPRKTERGFYNRKNLRKLKLVLCSVTHPEQQNNELKLKHGWVKPSCAIIFFPHLWYKIVEYAVRQHELWKNKTHPPSVSGDFFSQFILMVFAWIRW